MTLISPLKIYSEGGIVYNVIDNSGKYMKCEICFAGGEVVEKNHPKFKT